LLKKKKKITVERWEREKLVGREINLEEINEERDNAINERVKK
jgi:hypothetical protein